MATGKDFAEPIEVKGTGHLVETGVDGWAIASLRFPGDILPEDTGVLLGQGNSSFPDLEVSVRTMIVRGRRKRMGRGHVKTQNWKKAIVTLREGEKIEFFEAF